MHKRGNEPKVVLGMAVLDFKFPCVANLLESIQYLDGFLISPGALLPNSRNHCVANAYEKFPDFTHMLFIDDDMCNFGPAHMQKLLFNTIKEPYADVCSALVTFRTPPYNIVANFKDTEPVLEYIQTRAVVPVTHVGMAFTMIKREVFDAIREDTPDGPVWFTMDREPRENFDVEVADFIHEVMKETDNAQTYSLREVLHRAILLGQTSHLNTHLVGEDIAFCKRANKAGFKIYVDCGVPVGHMGDKICTFADNLKLVAEREMENARKQQLADVVDSVPGMDIPNLRLAPV